MKEILVPIAPGELIDKLTILQLKSERIADADKLRNVQHERAALQRVADDGLDQSGSLMALWDKLYQINADLWEIEDDIRRFEARGDFGPGFVALARSVYVTNDQRAAVKKQINLLLGSDLIEEKSYVPHGAST